MTTFDDPDGSGRQGDPHGPSDPRELVHFLKSRDARMACTFCGHERWRGWSERVSLARTDAAGRPLDPVVAVPLVCANCGLLRLQSAHVLADPRA